MSFRLFTFVQVSDSHARASDADWRARVERILRNIARINPTPAFILHSGDLMDEPSAEAARAHREWFANCVLPMRVAPGNHDVWNVPVTANDAPWWTRATTSADEQQFRAWFGATTCSFVVHGCAFVVLNSQLLNSAIPEASAQWAWLNAELARLSQMQPAHLILCGHMPLFVRMPDERLDPSDWRNPYLVVAPPARDSLLSLIRRYHVSAYLCGHWHYAMQRTITWPEGHATQFVVCPAAGPASTLAQQHFNLDPMPADSFGYCLHRVAQATITSEFVML